MTYKYKQSIIPWETDIPVHWDETKAKYLFTHIKQIIGDNWINEQRISLTYDGVIPRDNEDSSGLNPESLSTYQVIRKNELLFKLIDLENEKTSRVGLSNYDGITSSAYIRINVNHMNPKYYYYWYYSLWFRFIYNRLGNGVRSTLNAKDLLNIVVPVPSYIEQELIANTIEKKIDKINQLLNIQEQQIEKLKDYKQSLISEVVIKGLNPNIKMKESKVDFIGMIPEEWTFTKLLNVLEMKITDGPHETLNLIDEGIPFISAEAIKNDKIDFNLRRGNISQEDYEMCSKKYIPKVNDIYMVKSGATTGNIAIVETSDVFTIWSPLAVLRSNKNYNYKYLFYMVKSQNFQKQIQLNWTFGTQQNLGMRVLERLLILIPPYEEQIEIVKYLDYNIHIVNKLLETKQAKIEKLIDYKKSLIYEYVTGKKEVD